MLLKRPVSRNRAPDVEREPAAYTTDLTPTAPLRGVFCSKFTDHPISPSLALLD